MSDDDWQIHQANIAEKAKYILKTGLWSDCKFVVSTAQDRKEFKVHKLILSMSSPVFEKMFLDCFYKPDDAINIVDIQPEAFSAMLNYIYADEIKIQSFDQACELYYIANKYMMPKLLNHCTSYIWQEVNNTNACRGYEFAKLFDQHQLMEKCQTIILTETYAVVSHSSFSKIQLSTLKMILEQKTLNMSELQLFKALEAWTQAELERKEIGGKDHADQQQAIYDELVPFICFLNMKPTEFAEGPAISSLLTKEQAFAILMNLLSPNCSIPMPSGFSKCIREKQTDDKKENIFLKLPLVDAMDRRMFVEYNKMSFTCDKDIEIKGVAMLTGRNYPNKANEYREHVNINVRSKFNNAKRTYQDIVVSGSIINMYFESPVKIFHGQMYELSLQLLSRNVVYFTKEICSQVLVHESVKFQFLHPTKLCALEGFIFSLETSC